ncbi:MAG: hypothetical protein LBN97_07255 [Oscillospiraceae bacterium]|jgi:hypothetical protein|nr:hypothetical protein [Oscillospiraceae bacterium]
MCVLASVILPFLFAVFYAFRRKLRLVPFVAGIAAFLVCGWFLGGLIMGSVTKEVLRPILLAGVECAGFLGALLFLSKRERSVGVPASLALGYALIPCAFSSGFAVLSRLSVAMTLNDIGIEEFLANIKPESLEAAEATIDAMLAQTPGQIYLVALEYLANFARIAAMVRLLWYYTIPDTFPAADAEGSKPRLSMVLPIAFAIAAYYLGERLYQNGGQIAYYIAAAVIIAAAVYLAKKYDSDGDIHSDRLSVRWRRRR